MSRWLARLALVRDAALWQPRRSCVRRLVRGRTPGEAGQSALLIAGIMAFLATVGLIAVNTGLLIASRTTVQRAADAAALAACADLPNTAEANATANSYVTEQNNTGSGIERVSNSLASPPTISTTTLPNDTISLAVTRSQPAVMLSSLGIGPFAIGAHATCRRLEGYRPSMLGLGDAAGTITVNSGASVNMGVSGLVVNSMNTAALTVAGGASVTGMFNQTGSGQASIAGTIQALVSKKDPAEPDDPYAGVCEPLLLDPGGCSLDIPPYVLTIPPLTQNDPRGPCAGTYLVNPNETSPRNPHHCHIMSDATLDPGIYWGGLELGAFYGGAVTIKLNPGVYYLAGGGGGGSEAGGLRVWADTTLIGDGVIFINADDPFALIPLQQACGSIEIHDRAKLQLTPPASTSEFGGILFFQLSVCNAYTSTPPELVIDAGPTVGVQMQPCVIYWPTGTVRFTGSVTVNGIVVANQIVVSGNVTFTGFILSGTLFHGQIKLIN